MCKKSKSLTLYALAMTIALSSTTWGALVGHWRLDETSGTVATDSSGNGLNGTVQGGGTWVAGKIGGALQTDGTDDYVDLGNPAALDLSGANQATITAWVKPAVTKNHNAIFTKGEWSAAYSLTIKGDTTPPNRLWTGNNTSVFSTDAVPVNEWTHVAVTIRGDLTNFYINGRLNGPANQDRGEPIDNSVRTAAIGREDRSGSNARWYFNGLLDDVRVYNEALPEAQIQVIMTGRDSGAGLATAPIPADRQTDVLRDVVLSWKPGPFAATHDVYFGASPADVNSATTAQPLGVLASAGQDANTFDPAGLLEFGQTYYWRVDEVNAAPDNTVFKGKVWSFTAEPYAYPLTNVTATASSSHSADMGPQKTVDGSGLDAAGLLHGTTDNTMWLSSGTGPKPDWIQYQFDRLYKLDEMQVWNSNQAIESFAGLGARNVTVEYSTDGSTWTPLAGVPEFAKATGAPGYASNTTVDFAGVAARYVKLTINSNWGTMPQTGLSEVRFYQIPVFAREPKPASAATGTGPDVVLSWRSGREAVSHQVYLSADSNAVADGTALIETVNQSSYTPKALDLGKTYYWKVVEVNNAATPATWESDVWSFTVANYVVIDDFESYTNESPNRVFQAWIDGFGFSEDEFFPAGNPGNSTGSGVGHDIWNTNHTTIAETTIVHGGKQSMPLYYNNSSIPTSEADRTWNTAQNWTTNGADTLTLYLRGSPVGFAEVSPGHILMSGIGADIYSTTDRGRFVYKQLTGDGTILARVDHLDNTNEWAKAGVMIRTSLDPSSAWAYVLWAGENGVRFQMRPTIAGAGASDTEIGPPADQVALRTPVWVKLERTGNDFKGYYSLDGKAWTPLAWNPRTITMNASVYIGLAVTSHSTTVAAQAEFSGVVTTGNVTGEWQSEALSVEQPAGNLLDTLYLTLEDSSSHKATVVNPDPYAVAAGAWTPWSIPLSTFTSAGVKTDSIKKMIIGVGDKAKPASGATGLIYIDDIGYGRPASQ